MVDQAAIQKHVAYGMGIAATKLGSTYTVYRPTGAMNPMQQPALRTQFMAFDNASKFSLAAPNALSKPNSYALMDTTDVRVGDILVGPETYFVSEFAQIQPPQVQQCNLTVTFFTTSVENEQPVGLTQPYWGRSNATDTLVASGWPVSATMKAKGEMAIAKLADDVRAGQFEVVVPPIPGLIVTQGLRFTDQIGTNYMIGGVEPLAYGCTKLLATVATT